MSVIAILVGLSCGLLLAAVALGLGSGYRGGRSLLRGAQAAAWGSAGVLVLGALLTWGSGLPALESLIGVIDRGALEGPVLSLVLMAGLAVPLKVERPEVALWSCGLLYLPAWLLSTAALVEMSTPSTAPLDTGWITPVRFSLAVCGGLGARAVGQSLQLMATGIPAIAWPGQLAYGLMTVLVGSATLINLWQRGRMWAGPDPILRGGITGAWLAWTADWLAPRRHGRLRAGLTIVAGLFLIFAAIKPA